MLEVIKPFGPSIAKTKIPEEMVETLNKYVDKIIADEMKSKELNFGSQLAGNVRQEFKLESQFMEKCGWGNFLAQSASKWISESLKNSAKRKKNITQFNILHSWIVRQFENDYNPLHTHNGHISGVGYLKLPSSYGGTHQADKQINKNGTLQLVHGSKMFMCESTYGVMPEIGDFYFFPNYMMHTVYPFVNKNNEERRSISFNALIDHDIYNAFSA
tara:strand:- start:437 stop:1084 length:648 start_codon:yes stop_codon:yes gene_type:complete